MCVFSMHFCILITPHLITHNPLLAYTVQRRRSIYAEKVSGVDDIVACDNYVFHSIIVAIKVYGMQFH